LISGFRRRVNDILAFLGCYTAYIVVTDVSGQSGRLIFKGQAVQEEYRQHLGTQSCREWSSENVTLVNSVMFFSFFPPPPCISAFPALGDGLMMWSRFSSQQPSGTSTFCPSSESSTLQ
jgi:hypothetical protein